MSICEALSHDARLTKTSSPILAQLPVEADMERSPIVATTKNERMLVVLQIIGWLMSQILGGDGSTWGVYLVGCS